MARKDAFFDMLAKGVDMGSAGAKQKMAEAHDLAKLAQADQIKQAEAQRQLDLFDRLRSENPKAAVRVNDYSINPEPPMNVRMQLTPAQESAERTVGKQIADFEASGGRPAMEKNLQSLKEVQGDLRGKKRDRWDRGVGALFGTSPSLLGIFGSTEKGRRDKARNTALTIAKQTDPNPTEKQIESIMGQIYDPASSDEDNEARITRFLEEQDKKMLQMEQAAQNYKRTGYATFGGPGRAAVPPPPAKIRVSNGIETLEIDASDLEHALADGYQKVK